MGWERLCNELDEDNRSIWRAEFVRIYRLGTANRARLEYLAGPQERWNDTAGRDLTPRLCGRPDWSELPACRSTRPALDGPEPLELGDLFRRLPGGERDGVD
jgi:hypothetical protein